MVRGGAGVGRGRDRAPRSLPTASSPPSLPGPTVHHFDLYRLGGGGGARVSDAARGGSASTAAAGPPPSLSALDADRVGLAAALDDGVCLIEWADRLGAKAPAGRLEVAIEPLAPAEATAAASAAGLPPPPPADAAAPYDDDRWRRITLTPHGGRAAELVAAAVEGVAAGPDLAPLP